MKNKIKSLAVVAALILSVNNVTVASENKLRVGEIKVTKLKQLPENVILSKLPVRMGEEYTNKDLNDIYLALKRLDYVSDVNVYPRMSGDVVNLEIEVSERANAMELIRMAEERERLKIKTEYVISDIVIEGLNTVKKEQVLPILPVKVGMHLTPQDAVDGVQKIFETGLFAKVDLLMDRKSNNTVVVKYIVEENPVITDIKIRGNALFSEAQLIEALGIKKGSILNANLINPELNGIIAVYHKNGYSLARVEAISLVDGVLQIGLTEGIVNEVNFKKRMPREDGERRSEIDTKLRTKPFVFERVQAIKPGEVYQDQKVEETIRELYRTGIFTSIEPVLTGSATDPNVRNVDFIVQERPTISLNGSISYGTEVGLVGGIKLADSNFLGRTQEALFNVELSNKGDKTVEVSLFDPWIQGTERVQGGGSVYFRESYSEHGGPHSIGRVNRLGTRWTLGKGLNSNIFVRSSFTLDHYKEYLGNKMLSDKYNLVSLSPSIIYDTRNNAYNPSKGVFATLSFETGKLFSRQSILDKKGRNYNQFEADLRAYHPTFFKDKNVMAYRLVWGKTSSGTPEALTYAIGGSETLRGYEYGDFGGFDKIHGTIENRTKINDMLQLVAFVDFGNAWQKSEKIKTSKGLEYVKITPDRKAAGQFRDIKVGYGVGVRLETPLGPLRFDYGWPMNSVKKGKAKTGGKFYFSFGQTF